MIWVRIPMVILFKIYRFQRSMYSRYFALLNHGTSIYISFGNILNYSSTCTLGSMIQHAQTDRGIMIQHTQTDQGIMIQHVAKH